MNKPYFLTFALTAPLIMYRYNSTAIRARITLPFFLHQCSDSFFLHKIRLFYKTYPIPLPITPIQVLHASAGKLPAFIAIGKPLFYCTGLSYTIPAVPRLPFIASHATAAGRLRFAVHKAHHAIHAAWGKHLCIYFFRHLQ